VISNRFFCLTYLDDDDDEEDDDDDPKSVISTNIVAMDVETTNPETKWTSN
jgi:hypothetical protein